MSSRWALLPAVVGAFALLACNSDLQQAESETGTSTSTGSSSSSSTGDETTSTSTSTSTTSGTTGEPEPPKTCRDILECVGLCAVMADLACFQECAAGLSPEEGQKALELGLCIGMECFSNGSCTADDPMSQTCIACIGLSLLSPKPPGCEDQAAACM